MSSSSKRLVAAPRSPRRGLWAAVAAAVCAVLGLGCATAGLHAPPGAPRATPTRTVVFVHGMFVDGSCWDRWRPYFESRGYATLAPSWPAHGGSAAQARAAHPDPELAAVDLPAVLAHYRAVIAELDEPPILVGHSLGGLVVQILLSEGLASAAVAIDAAPPRGVFTFHPAFLKSNGRILRGSLDVPLDMELDRFSYMFTNTLSPAEQRAAWETHARPESRRIGRGPTSKDGAIDFGHSRAPLLLIAGSEDHAVPAVIVRKTFRRYRKADAITEFRELEVVDHWLIASDRWRDVAEVTAQWLVEQGAALSDRASAAGPARR